MFLEMQKFFPQEPSKKYAGPDRLRIFSGQAQDERSWKKGGQANMLAEWFAVGYIEKRWWAVGGSNPKPTD